MSDLIRREDAIRAIDSLGEVYILYYDLLMLINRLPSAEPEEMIVGYSTYKPEVLSQYLREDFISPAEPERKNGYWIVKEEDWRKQLEWDECSECGFATTKQYNFCPNCGADMKGDHE